MKVNLAKHYGVVLLLLILGGEGCVDRKTKQLIDEAPLISVQLTDGKNRNISLDEMPEHIISLAPNITEIFYALDAGELLVGVSEHCDYPDIVLSLPSVSIYPQLNLDELLEIEADLIVGLAENISPNLLKEVENAGTPIYLQQYNEWEEIYKGIAQVGEISQKTLEATKLIDSLTALTERIEKATREEVKYKVAVVVNTDPLTVIGGKGYVHSMIQKAGGSNAFADSAESLVQLTSEAFVQAAPEYIILPFRDDQIYAEWVSQHPILTTTPADIRKQVFIVEPDLFVRPGPRIFDGLLELTHILHNKLSPATFLQKKLTDQ